MQILRDLLTSAGYEIIEAENGEEALAAVAKRRPDLILMDIQLPIIDGYEVTRRIKADPALRSIPIIAITSYAMGEDEKRARAAGCDDFVRQALQPAPAAGEDSPVLELRKRYSGFMPAALATSGQRFSSALISVSNCAAEPPTASAACDTLMALRTAGVSST